jgi:hypothetical protein
MHRMVTHHEVGDGSHNRDEESDKRRVVETPPDLAETVRSLMVELQRCKADNKRLIKEKEKQMKINEVLLQNPTYKDNCSMDLTLVTQTDDRQRKVKVHLRYGDVIF